MKTLEELIKQTEFMTDNKIKTKEYLNNFTKNNYEKYSTLIGKEKTKRNDIIGQNKR